MASGLMHPYPGEQCLRSAWATEGIAQTRALLRVAEQELGMPVHREGLMRIAHSRAQCESLQAHAEQYGDIEPCGAQAFWIHSGATIFSARYLEGLTRAVIKRGARIVRKKIDALSELASYDVVLLAVGAGIRAFPECAALPLRFVKGQVLHCRVPQGTAPPHSILGKGHIAATEEGDRWCIGSTYERIYDFAADSDKAAAMILPKATALLLQAAQWEILECRAGVRVARKGHYLPMTAQINAKTWAITALGSRGLLYHALLAKRLAEALFA